MDSRMPDSFRTLISLLCSLALLFLLSACQIAAPTLSESLQEDIDALPTAASFQSTIFDMANGGGNLGRLAALDRRIDAKGLTPYLSKQHIDWFGLQKNLIVEIPGKSSKIVYIVAHYDKTEANPLTFVSLMLNGLLDPLISPTFFSDGALDNASGSSTVLELAHSRSQKENYYTYRFLFVGAEETGLRGSRVHVARLPDEEKSAIEFAINIDTVGVQGSETCLTEGISDPNLSYVAGTTARKLHLTLNHDPSPETSTSDYLPFQEISFPADFSYGIQLNFVGGLLPQRSWFTKPMTVPVMNFSSCGVMKTSSDFITNFLLPLSDLHSYRDSTALVDIEKLYELYLLIDKMLDDLDARAAEMDSTYRTAGNAPDTKIDNSL